MTVQARLMNATVMAERAAERTATVPSVMRPWLQALEDGLLLLLVVYMFPIAILAVGTPIALFVRLILEIVQGFGA